MTAADAMQAALLFETARADGAGGWSESAIAQTLANAGFGAIAPDVAGRIHGAALAIPAGPEAELVNLAVAANARRGGVGRELLTALAATAATIGFERLLLEVAADNFAARALYERFGFDKIGIRRDYYKRGPRSIDAEMMALDLRSITVASE